MWKGKLNTWASFSAPRKPVSKDVFAIILCEIWKEFLQKMLLPDLKLPGFTHLTNLSTLKNV